MKRLFLIIFGLFLMVGFIGCNRDGSDIKIDMDEFIDNPTNLTISGRTLSWDSVDNADGYIVYVDGEEEDKVDETFFDFSDLDGDVIVFQVRTRAPRGMQDSSLSVSIAYVANKEIEIALVESSLDNMDTIFVADGFAEELVNKGVTSADLSEMLSAYDAYIDTTNDYSSTTDDYIDSIRELFEEFDNIEGFISAIVKVELPSYLAVRIGTINSEISYYQAYGGTNMYTQEIAMLEQEKDMYEELLDEIEENPDRIILAITATIEYFASIEELVDDNLIDLVMNLTGTENPGDLNVSELESILDETVAILRETMPTEEEVVMVMDVSVLLMEMMGSTNNIEDRVDNYIIKSAAQTMYSLELFINFLDTFDNSFFESLDEELDSSHTEEMKQTELLILIIEVFDEFYDDNQNLFDTIDELYTDEEKEIIYENGTSLSEISNIQEMYGIDFSGLEGVSYSNLMDMQDLLDDSFDVFLDTLINNDCELIRQLSIKNGFMYSDYSNVITGEEYADYDEFNLARDSQQYDIYTEMFIVLDEVIQSYNEDDFNVILTYLTDYMYVLMSSQISMYNISEYNDYFIEQEKLDDIIDLIYPAVDELDENTLVFAQNIIEYIVDENFFEELKELEIEFDENNVSNDEEYYAKIIFLAGHYDSLMTNGNKDRLEGILDVVFDVLLESEIRDVTGMTLAQVAELETSFDEVLDLLDEDFAALKDYDYEDLSSSEIVAIEDFIDDFYSTLFGYEN